MPNMPGDTFICKKGIKYVLKYGPKGNLRPYTVGPVSEAVRKGGLALSKLGWTGLAIGAVILLGVGAWYICRDKE